MKPIVYGFSGRAGSGKSFFSKNMASFCQALYVDCDKIGHDLLCDDVIMDRLIRAFSSKIVKNGD